MHNARSLASRSVAALAFAALALVCGCRARADGLREWTAADHDRAEEEMKAAAAGSAAPAAPTARAAAAAEALANVVDVTWRTQCAQCHGMTGRGDGPRGQIIHARDMTDAAWQRSAKDDELANAIVNGRGKMPSFELSPDLVAALVKKVRSFGPR